jgi:hypothetical protein
MTDPSPRVLDSLLPDEPGPDSGPDSDGNGTTTMDPIKPDARRRLPFTNGNMSLRRSRRPVAIGGYTINRAGQVIVDPGEVFNDPEKLEEALKVARRAQQIGRQLTAAKV